MPNYCYNSLTVSGDPKLLKKFKEFAYTKDYYKGEKEEKNRDNILDFGKFVPRELTDEEKITVAYKGLCEKEKDKTLTKEEREELALMRIEHDQEELNYVMSDYDWHCKYWGTKWNSCFAEVDEDYEHNELKYNFDTAWGPALPVMFAMSQKFPELKIEVYYEESGMGFCGDFVCENGKVLIDESRELIDENEEEGEENDE